MDTFYNIVNKNHFCIDFSIVKNQIFVKLKYSEKSDFLHTFVNILCILRLHNFPSQFWDSRLNIKFNKKLNSALRADNGGSIKDLPWTARYNNTMMFEGIEGALNCAPWCRETQVIRTTAEHLIVVAFLGWV